MKSILNYKINNLVIYKMNKEIVKKILTKNQVDIIELNTFITEYTHEKLNRDITPEELKGIIQLIQNGVFNLRYAASEAAKMLDLNILSISDKNSKLIRVDVYESF